MSRISGHVNPAASGIMEPRTAKAGGRGDGLKQDIPLDVKSSLRQMGVKLSDLPQNVARDLARLSADEMQTLATIQAKIPSARADNEVEGYVVF